MKRLLLALMVPLTLAAAPRPVTEAMVRDALIPLETINTDDLKAMGPAVLPHLVKIYTATPDENARATYAWVFYSLGMKSPEARAALLRDVKTQNPKLRLQVQWALGRVSDDVQVVDILANIMRNDANPLFRDKAACALAYDQIHLTEKQKVQLYGKLIEALKDPKPQVRSIAIQALKIHTGQDKGFSADANDEVRSRSIARWTIWLAEYEKNL
ncbi:MAG TPA: HEAT repeat domain-containing protein [Thermoanaerobaculia bacterium]|nr:HEAT repeat domain-containing protein [Thermoanaerobaculia bacterium]